MRALGHDVFVNACHPLGASFIYLIGFLIKKKKNDASCDVQTTVFIRYILVSLHTVLGERDKDPKLI